MTIQHASIPDGQIHEPKGISTAVNRSLYIANGIGSGAWARPDATVLQGLSGDGGSNNKKIMSDGSNGFRYVIDEAYGIMGFAANANALTISAASASDLSTNYQKLTGVGVPLAGELLFGTTFSTDTLTLPTAGVYRIELQASMSALPTASKVGFKVQQNASLIARKAVTSGTTTDSRTVFLQMYITAAINDTLSAYVASTVTGALTLSDFALSAELIRAT